MLTEESSLVYVRDVCIRMQPEHFGRVVRGQELYEIKIFLQFCDTRDDVSLEEVERWLEHVIPKPDLAECDEESFVEVVRHSPAILDLTKHVAHRSPVDSLNRQQCLVGCCRKVQQIPTDFVCLWFYG